MQMRDVLGSIYTDEDFADLFPKDEQPTEAPWWLALVTVMHFIENLSDQQAAETATIHAELERKALVPSKHLVDTDYVDAKLLLESHVNLKKMMGLYSSSTCFYWLFPSPSMSPVHSRDAQSVSEKLDLPLLTFGVSL